MHILNRIKTIFTALMLFVAILMPVHTYAQAEYSCDAYGAGEYQNNQCAEPGGTSGGKLSNTGRNILLFGGIGILGVIGGGALLYFTLKRSRNDTKD